MDRKQYIDIRIDKWKSEKFAKDGSYTYTELMAEKDRLCQEWEEKNR